MKLTLNKTIKTHIADMAIRKKHKAEFERLMQCLKDKAHTELYKKYHNADFDALPDRAKNLVQSSRTVDIPAIYMGGKGSFDLQIALQTRERIHHLELDVRILGESYHFHNALELFNSEYKSLRLFLKQASSDRDTLLEAMAHYRSAEKMFKELPWTEDFYPEEHKKPKCNIVPVSTIAAANKLMKI